METSIIKQDVINELRNQRYYNEQEILRLVGQDSMSHQERVRSIAEYLKQNVSLIESIKLMEAYYPAEKKSVAPAPSEELPLTPTEDVN